MELEPVELSRFFRPERVAVIGASDAAGRESTASWQLLRKWAYRVGAAIHPVNPNRRSVDGFPCVGRLADVPGPIDVVAVLVRDVAGAVAQAVDCGAAFAVVFSAGFAEASADGREAQERLRALLEGSKLRLIGPNTNLNAFETFRDDLAGPAIALITQSGHQGRQVFLGQDNGIRVSHWAPTGNEVDLEFADFVRWFADQPEVGAIAAYVEGFRDGRTLMLAADRCVQADVPLTVLKVGATAVGRRAASSHTGKLAGSDCLTSAVFRQFGVTRVDDLDQLLDTCQVFARARPPVLRPGTRPEEAGVVVYSISGGLAAHTADRCSAEGLFLPTLSRATQDRLRRWIPDYLRVTNPVDCGGLPAADTRIKKILKTLAADPDVSVIICPMPATIPGVTDTLAQDLVALGARTDKLICAVWGSPVGTEPELRDVLLRSGRVAVFRSTGNCVRAVRAWLDWHSFRARFHSPFAKPALRRSSSVATASDRLRAGEALSEHGSKQLLASYGIPVTRDVLVSTSADAVRAAQQIGYPVVLKACGADLVHKSDVDLVRLGLTNAAAVRGAHAELAGRGSEGVLVCEHVADGVETALGLIHDPLFGPAIMVGLGGLFVEAMNDVAFRVTPFDRAEARRMLDELQGSAVFEGLRGRPPADVAALVDVIMKLQRLAIDLHDEVAEIDINPLMVRRRGEGVVALDGLVVAR